MFCNGYICRKYIKHGLFFFNYVILTPILCLNAVIIWTRNVLKLGYIKVQLLARRIIKPKALLLLKNCTVVRLSAIPICYRQYSKRSPDCAVHYRPPMP